jgi:diguanylate cyclase (GGDEF)-like protein/PAS domain S-box-containing protein
MEFPNYVEFSKLRPRARRGQLIGAGAVFGCYAATFTLGVAILPPSSFVAIAFTDVASMIAPFLAGAACLYAAARGVARNRQAWACLAAACVVYGIGDATWAFYEVGLRRETPFPSFADVAYLAMIPLMFLGLVLLSPTARGLASLRTALDAVTVIGAATAGVWHFVMRPTYEESSVSILAKSVGAAYPAGDLVLFFGLFLVLYRYRRGRAGVVLAVFSAGLAIFMASDVAFAYLTLNDTYATGSIVDLGWPIGFVLMGYAGVVQGLWGPDDLREERETVSAGWRQSLPLGLLLVIVAVLVGAGITGSFPGDPILAAMLLAVTVSVVIRQSIVMTDNVGLNKELSSVGEQLERRVATRTVDLQRALGEQHLAAAALRRSEERFRRLTEDSPVGIYQMTADRSELYLNPAGLEIFEAQTGDDVVKAGYERFFSPADLQTISLEESKRAMGIASNYEVALAGFRGTRRTVLISGAPLLDEHGRLQSVVGTITDISERKRLEEALRHQAFHDPLTRLANRARFRDRLEHAMTRSTRSETGFAVLFMDLDDFKSINDRFGHSIGDLTLVEVARRLESCLRPGDTAARFGGDEFAILLEDLAAVEEASDVAARVLQALSAPLIWDRKELSLQASMGIAFGREPVGTEEILRNADVAMYAAKSRGKSRFALYEEAMHVSMVDRLEILGDLQRAVERQEFVVHYQPTVELRSGRIAGVEALVRWNHPTRGLLPPADFIPPAEESGAIIALGTWVLRTACLDMKRWHAVYPAERPLSLSVNISALQIRRPEFVGEVREILAESGLVPGSLVLEVTESLLMRDVESTLRQLQELKSLGIQLAIDDFGTGYSSLSYLSQFPFDILKIDKSFVDGVGDDDGEKQLVPAIIDLGKMLKMQIVAEGIERPEQLARLRSLACDLGQGFLFARPLVPEEIDEMLKSTSNRLDAA